MVGPLHTGDTQWTMSGMKTKLKLLAKVYGVVILLCRGIGAGRDEVSLVGGY
jgi:hypothetical protein